MKTLVATMEPDDEIKAERAKTIEALEAWRKREMKKFTRMIAENS